MRGRCSRRPTEAGPSAISWSVLRISIASGPSVRSTTLASDASRLSPPSRQAPSDRLGHQRCRCRAAGDLPGADVSRDSNATTLTRDTRRGAGHQDCRSADNRWPWTLGPSEGVPLARRSRLGRTGADGFDTRGGLLGMPKERSSQEVHNLGRHGRGCRYVTSQNNWAIVFIGRNRR